MNIHPFIIAFVSLVYYEFRRLLKGSHSSYFWFVFLVLISTYSLFARTYVDASGDQTLINFKYGDAPMGDILIFISSYIVSSGDEVVSGTIPGLQFPAFIGIAFYILFPLMISLTLISKFIMKKAATSISGEKEKKTLYILVASSQTRSSIFIGKFIGIFILTLPMIIFSYILSLWAFSNLFPKDLHLTGPVLIGSITAALLFGSIGMLISVLWNNEKKAAWTGTKVIAASGALTSLWIFIPILEFGFNLLNKNTYILTILEKITQISPFTLNLMAVYDPSFSTFSFGIQVFIALVFFILGIVMFIRQDLEY